MKFRGPSLSAAFRAILTGATLVGATTAAAVAVAATQQERIDQLASAIAQAAISAQADSQAQGLTPEQTQAAVAAAIEAVIAQSGEDMSVVLAALGRANTLLASAGHANDAAALALAEVRSDVTRNNIATGGRPSGKAGVNAPPTSGGSGGGTTYSNNNP